LRRFLACGVQSLQPEADSKKWNTRGDAIKQGLPEPAIVQRAHHLSEMPDSGKNQLLGVLEPARRLQHRILTADLVQSVLNAAQIAGSIVDDGDHKSPFVEGS